MCVAKGVLDLHHALTAMITGCFKGHPENDILSSLSGTQLAPIAAYIKQCGIKVTGGDFLCGPCMFVILQATSIQINIQVYKGPYRTCVSLQT